MWCDVRRIHGGNDNRDVSHLAGVSSIAANDTDDSRLNLLGILDRADKIGAHIQFQVSAANGEYQETVLFV